MRGNKMRAYTANMLFAIGCAASMAGCASRSENVSAAYVSPNAYQSYSCEQIRAEASRVSSRAAAATGTQNSKATSDAVTTGVAVVLFWPAAFFIKGDGAGAAELSRLKGEMEALEQASVQKKCNIVFRREA
jgi:Fe-S cluster assembly scaffold protein SufB